MPKVKPKVGRPKRIFTPDQIADIERLAKLNLNTETIADALDIPVNTLKSNFRRQLTQKRAQGKAEIAEAQRSMLKQPVMAIWLGKQHLGQSDVQKIEVGSMLPIVIRHQQGPG